MVEKKERITKGKSLTEMFNYVTFGHNPPPPHAYHHHYIMECLDIWLMIKIEIKLKIHIGIVTSGLGNARWNQCAIVMGVFVVGV